MIWKGRRIVVSKEIVIRIEVLLSNVVINFQIIQEEKEDQSHNNNDDNGFNDDNAGLHYIIANITMIIITLYQIKHSVLSALAYALAYSNERDTTPKCDPTRHPLNTLKHMPHLSLSTIPESHTCLYTGTDLNATFRSHIELNVCMNPKDHLRRVRL